MECWLSRTVEFKPGMSIGSVREGLAIHSCFTDGRRVTIDMSANKNPSDEERKAGKCAAGGRSPILPKIRRSLTGITDDKAETNPARLVR